MEFSLATGWPGLSLRRPEPVLCAALQHALNASFTAHCEFLPWAKPWISEDEARVSMARSFDDFQSETGECRFFIVADEGPVILGCIGLKPRGRNRYVVGYWANTDYSGKGHLRRALEALVNRLPGCTFYLTTSSANVPSQRLAVAAGFQLVRVHPRARHSERHGVQDTYLYRLKQP